MNLLFTGTQICRLDSPGIWRTENTGFLTSLLYRMLSPSTTVSGACVPSPVCSSSTCSDGDDCTTDTCVQGRCENTAMPNCPAPTPAPVVALLFVGHGEPRTFEAGNMPIVLADGTPFGPHAAQLGVPEDFQHTEWAAAYDEIATAMTYTFPFQDTNQNGIEHEVTIVPNGDVPAFFTWNAFHAELQQHYDACNNFSPHNDALIQHVSSLDITVPGASHVDVYTALLDAVPRIRDVVWEIANDDKKYDKLAVVPMLIAESTHTDEVDELVREAEYLTEGMTVVVSMPFFEVSFMRRRLINAVVSMAEHVRTELPADISDDKIGVVLASHGTPYFPARSEFGWKEGEIYSNLIPTEDAFHQDVDTRLPWKSLTGRMSYSAPTIEEALDEFEADGMTDVMVIPSAFPTAAIHTMWDVANAAIERAVLPEEGVVSHTRPSGMKVHFTSIGFADTEPARSEFRRGLQFMGMVSVMEALYEKDTVDDDN